MNSVAEGLGRPAKFSFFNGYAFASWQFENSDRDKTQLFGTWSGLDVYKLQLCDELARHVASYSAESKTGSSANSIHDPESNNWSWLKTVQRYLGGTLYGIKLGEIRKVDEDEELPSNSATIKDRILHLASVGPNVFKQLTKAGRSTRTYVGERPRETVDGAGDISVQPLEKTLPGDDSMQESLDIQRLFTVSKDTLGPTVSSIRAASVAGSGNSVKRNMTKFSSRIPWKANIKKPKLKHIQIFKSIAVSDALRRLRQIRSAPSPYPSWLSIIIFGLSSAGCCAIFFGGGWNDFFASLILGCIVGVVAKVCALSESFQRISEFLSSLIVGFCCRLLVVWNVPICVGSTTISSIIQIVQGTNITLSVMELASRHPGAGVSRLGYSLTVTALIGIGLEFGDALALAITKSTKSVELTVLSICPQGLSLDTQWLVFIPTILVFLIDLNGHPRQYFFMALTSTVAQTIWTYAYPSLGDPLSSFLAAFSMGVVSNVYSYFSLSNPIVGVLAGLQVLVPGTLAVRAFNSQDVTSGVALAGSVLLIALSMGLALFLGSVFAAGIVSFFRKGKTLNIRPVLTL